MVSILIIISVVCNVILFLLLRKEKNVSRWKSYRIAEQNHRIKNNFQVINGLLNLQKNRLKDLDTKKVLNETILRIQTMTFLNYILYEDPLTNDIDLSVYIPELVNSILQSYGLNILRPVYVIDSVDIGIDKSLNLGLIINELITNACKYAFVENENPELYITCKKDRNHIFVIIKDNGPGFVLENGKDTFGMLLINIQSQNMKGKYCFEFDNGTIFKFSFKL